MTKIRVNLLNLSRCKQVELELPCADTEMREKIEEAGVESDPLRPCAMIDLIEPVQLNGLSGSTVSLDELNFLAKRLDSFTSQEMERFYTGVQYGGSLVLKDLINLTYNLHKYVLVRDVGSPEKIGLTYALQHGGSVPADYERTEACRKLGKTLMNSGEGVFTDHGLLFIDEKPMEEVYDGVTFPDYCWDESPLMTVSLGYNDRAELLYLPCEELSVEKAAARLGAASLEECSVYIAWASDMGSAWAERAKGIVDREGLLVANRLLDKLAETDLDLGKLDAISRFIGVERSENLLYLAENISEFEFIPGIQTEEEYGHHLVDNDRAYAMNPDMEEFFDFESFGEYMREENGAEFSNGGLLRYDGPDSLRNFLCGLEPEDGGFKMTMG